MIDKFSTLNGAKYFSSGKLQNYLVFITAKKYINNFSGTTKIDSWNSNGMSEENIANKTKSDSNFASIFVDHHVLQDLVTTFTTRFYNFNGHCLINNNISIIKKVVNLYISYVLNPWLRNLNTDFTLQNSLFRSLKLTKNANPDKYKYSGFSIGFDCRLEFTFIYGNMGRMSLLLELI